MSKNNSSRFKSREWILLILLIALVEYVIFFWSNLFGDVEDVVRTVSFAGTIVGIILAVLAIVYSYYQNFAQRRDSQNLATQIEFLRSVIQNVDGSTDTLIDQLSKLDSMTGKIDSSIDILAESKKKIENLEELIQLLFDEDQFDQQAVAKKPAGELTTFIVSTAARLSVLYLFRKRKRFYDDPRSERVFGFAEVYSEAMNRPGRDEFFYGLAVGTLIEWLMILEKAALVTRVESDIEFTPPLQHFVENEIIDAYKSEIESRFDGLLVKQ